MSKDLLIKVFEKANQKQIIDEEIISFLEEIFPDKSSNVFESMKRGVTKYISTPSNRVIWTVMGEKTEHLVYPKLFCSCQDFYKSVVILRKREFCKHILAQIIVEAFGTFKEKVLKDSKVKELLNHLKLEL
jgi:predicted nucleic acid-binding Zn finger protein